MSQLFETKTKIVATLGPSSSTIPVIEAMLQSGLNVARVNMSHGDHQTHEALIQTARRCATKTKRPLAILQDLAGPKIRIGDFETEEITLTPGQAFTLTTKETTGTQDCVFVNYPKLPDEVKPGMHIYLNDGKQKLLVEKVGRATIKTTVIAGGTIRGRRGVNIPDANLSISSLTPKDRKDLAFGLKLGVDFVTLSFVRTASDILQLRKLIGKKKSVAIVAKIETKAAIENLEEIVAVADIIMVARGDLAIEMPLEKVPLLQKQIIHVANKAGKPVITATQMLDSMRTAVTPTRAEVTDIANAILDGTDALMLSDETAVGLYPERAISIMSKIAKEVEQDPFFIECQANWDFAPRNVCDAVGQSITKSAVSVGAKAIFAFTESGYTARVLARYRPRVPIVVVTPHHYTFHQSLVVYGCEPVLAKSVKNLNDARKIARKILLTERNGQKGDTFVLAAGIPFGAPGSTNMMVVEHI